MKTKSLLDFKISLPIAAGILAVILILIVSSKYGLAISPDSACYLSIAENINNGKGFLIYDNSPAVAWPPLYPLVLAFGNLIGFDLYLWVRLLNALLFGMILFLSARWLTTKITNKWLAIVGVIAILLSVPLWNVVKFAWSEALFIFILLLFLMRLEKSFPKHKLSDVVILAILTALACLTRYIGVSLILFYFFWLLFLKMKIKPKIISAAVFSLISFTPLLLWLWRNWNVSGTFTGERAESSTSIFKNFFTMVDSFSIWFFPIEVPADTRTIIVGVLLVLSIAWFFRKNLRQILRNGFQQILLMNWGFIFIYSAYLLIVSSLVAFDAIYHRFTAPLYIPFVVSVLVAIAQTKKFNITLKIIGNALIVAWIGYLGYTMIIDIKTSLSEGAGSFASTYWQDMEFPKYIAQNPPDGIVYSNFPDALYLFSNLPASLSPRKHFYRSRNSETGDIEKLQSELDSGNQVFLVWFTEVGRGFLYTPQELGNVLLVEEREKQSDGIVYHLSRKPPGDMP